ncbi:MAG TPA: hypothetical protein VKP64_13425 [Mycobacteriales bacterium]|nr:hypothetical protein [Mycobacteriales bacterium]
MTQDTGTVAEEAARLVAALQQWARHTAGAGLAGLGARVATGSTECQLCPLCQLLSLAKHANPEVLVHLSDANAALLAAVRAILEARDRAGAGARPGGLEHIEIS